GYAVDVVEPDTQTTLKARANIADMADRAGAGAVLSCIDFYDALRASIDDAVVAIEAVTERLEVKRGVFTALERSLPATALLATNTSSLSVNEIAEAVSQPERVLGLHFFNPAQLMKLVEIVAGRETSDETIERARAFVQRLDKSAVLAEDTPGFIVNRVARPFYLQSLRAYSEDVASMEDLDRLARGVGFRMGPFELMDLIGLDVNLATSESLYEHLDAPRFEPSALQRDYVARGQLGRKTLRGFYDYTAGLPKPDDSVPSPPQTQNDDEEIVVVGMGGVADEFVEELEPSYVNVRTFSFEEESVEDLAGATVVIDVGDGATDRTDFIVQVDEVCPSETIIFVDAYATDVEALADRVEHPERIVGYGVLASLSGQRFIEIVDLVQSNDDTLEMAQELFAAMGKGVVLVGTAPGLYLGRTVGSIVNEAVYVVEERVATPDDVDTAMKLGTNYPKGPIEWGREIGGDRIRRILDRLAESEGRAFGPHRALWVLDVQDESDARTVAEAEGAI
ncbi:MAG: hypothetical protein JO165_08455, partial [Candidatus Eremiobacteraeota bacterium]|nr:hypothetical protein [Candidatus Eremiobacteraeota bacterium]